MLVESDELVEDEVLGVTVVILSENDFNWSKRELRMEMWLPNLLIRGDEEGITRYGCGDIFPWVCLGSADSAGAAEFLLRPSKADTKSLYVSDWNINDEDFLGDLDSKDFERMFERMEERGAVPGPWTADRLAEVLDKIREAVYDATPSDDEEEESE